MDTRDQATWSLGLGRWAGAVVEVHLFFAAFVILTFSWAWLGPEVAGDDLAANMGIATAGLAILFSSLLVHEAGHFLASHRAQGHVSQVTLMPWGGIESVYLPNAAGRIIFYFAGPLANLCVATSCLIGLQFGLDQSIGWEYLNPLQPQWSLDDPYPLLATKFMFWLNWLLFVVNMLPGLPFDGGHLVPAILRIALPRLPHARLVSISASVTVVIAVVMLVVAFSLVSRPDEVYPASFALLPLAVTLFFSSRLYSRLPDDQLVDDWSYEDMFGDDGEDLDDTVTYYEELYGDSDEDDDVISDWLMERQADREKTLRKIEEEEELQADDILAKLHEHGLDSLTDEERSLLHRVSARYRRKTREEGLRG